MKAYGVPNGTLQISDNKISKKNKIIHPKMLIMKRFTLIFFIQSIFIFNCNAQILKKLNASEAPFDQLSEIERRFIQTYNENKRWDIFKKSQAKMLLNEGPAFTPVWESIGPNTIDTLAGRMLCLDFHPNNSDILFAGAGAGGLWKSENGGASWVALTDDLPSMRVSAVAVNPNNPDEILIGTGIGQVLSTALQPGVGVLKSTDGGTTWEVTSFSFNLTDIVSTYKIVYDPFIENKVYLAATNGFFISTDGGDNWTSTNPNRIYDIEIHPTTEGTIYIGTQLVGVQRSTNGGLTWTTLTNGIPSGSTIFRTDIAICQNSPDFLVAKMVSNGTFNTAGIYKTSDGGNSWITVPNAPDVACQPSNPNACTGWLFNTIGIAPDDPDKIFLGGVQFWYTHDGGTNWVWKDYLSNGSGTGQGNVNLVYVDHWDIDFDFSNSGRMYVCCDGGVIRSDDYGLTWTRMSNDLVNAMAYSSATHPANPDFMIAGIHDHGLQRWVGDNNNLTWTRWSFNDGISTLIDHQHSGVIYGNTQNGPVIKSFSNGSSVTTSLLVTNGIQESGPWISPLIMNHENTNILYTATGTRIYKTTNGASSWSVSANIPNVQTMEISKQNPDIIYAHAYNPFSPGGVFFYRSENGGANWNSNSNNTIPEWGTTSITSDPHQEGKIYATFNNPGNSNHIKVSDDHGDTWTNINNDFPDIKVNDILVSPYQQNHLFLATDLGVYFSNNSGENWCPFNNNLPRIYSMDLHISEADSTLRVATYGRGIWKTGLKELLTSSDNINLTDNQPSINVFPNPVKEVINIQIANPFPVSINADLYDQQGRKVMHLFGQSDRVTTFQKIIPIDFSLTPGIYYCRILIGKYTYHKKLIVK